MRRSAGERIQINCVVKKVKFPQSQNDLGHLHLVDGIWNAQKYATVFNNFLISAVEEHYSYTHSLILQNDLCFDWKKIVYKIFIQY